MVCLLDVVLVQDIQLLEVKAGRASWRLWRGLHLCSSKLSTLGKDGLKSNLCIL